MNATINKIFLLVSILLSPLESVRARGDDNPASSIIGEITNPQTGSYGGFNNPGGGIIGLFSNILRLLFVIAGMYSLLNFIMGGFGFMSAGGDSKKIGEAWNKIWQTLMGLVFIVGSFALAALFGQLIFGNANFILSPKIYGPGN